MAMDLRYAFRIAGPDERVAVGMCASDSGSTVLNAVLTATREPLTDRGLARVFLSVPAVTLKVIAAIHWQAIRLWAKGIRLQPRRASAARTAAISTSSD